MIKVDIKHQKDRIIEVIIHDHAGYADKGMDLVCAGVSCIAVGSLNALERLCSSMCDLEMKDAYISIKVNKQDDPQVQLILQVMCIQLETMLQSYKKFIKINDQEV